MVNTFDTGLIPDEEIGNIVTKLFDLTPKGIITALDLKNRYTKRQQPMVTLVRSEFSWEKINYADEIKHLAGKLGA